MEILAILVIGSLLLLAHFVGDYFIQLRLKKILEARGIKYVHIGKNATVCLLLHCLTYLIPFAPLILLLNLNNWTLALLFGSHFLIDKYLTKLEAKEQESQYILSDFLKGIILKRKFGVIKMARFQVIDQLLHYLVLGLVVLTLY